MNLDNEPWAILNKCERMVDNYIADMDKCLTCSEWPNSYPEPKYYNVLDNYLRKVWLINRLNKHNAKFEYICLTVRKLKSYRESIGLKL